MIRFRSALFLSAPVLALLAATRPSPCVQDASAAPGAEHARLCKLAGDWTVDTTFVLAPGAKAQQFHGTAHARAILGGRFVQFDETAVEFGQPVERQKTWGFNNAAKTFESVWVYTGSTAVMRLTGAAAADGKSVAGRATFDGEGQEPQQFTWSTQWIDDDHFVNVLVAPGRGKGTGPTFTAEYTRKK